MLLRLIRRIDPPPARAWWWMAPYAVGYFSCGLGGFAGAHHTPAWLVVLAAIGAGLPLALADKLYERAVNRAVWRAIEAEEGTNEP